MSDATGAAIIGYVLFALASLVGLAVGVKQLLKPSGSASNGNGSHDVSRREFQEVKDYQREAVHELRDRLQKLIVEVAVIKQTRHKRSTETPTRTP